MSQRPKEKPMLWIELHDDHDGLVASTFEDDQQTDATLEVTNPLQHATIARVLGSFDETLCEAADNHTRPHPLGAWLFEDDDEPWRSGGRLTPFFVTTDGKVLCEDCGIEILEHQNVVVAG